MPIPLIIDVDTGTDDAIAIMLAALRPELKLVACTTVFGNHGIAECTDNTLRVLDLLQRPDVPVYEGEHRPLRAASAPEVDPRSKSIHGEQFPLPTTTRRKESISAAEYLVRTFAEPTDTVLVAVAPLTNLATALVANPRIAQNIPRLIVMGGGHAVGNSTPSAEHNIWADPEAAAIVFAAGIPRIDVVTLDATHRALFSSADEDALASAGNPAANTAATLIAQRIAGYDETQPMVVAGTAPVHDPLCIALLVDADVAPGARHVHVDIELDGHFTRGRTVFDLNRRGSGPPNCFVHLDCDAERFVRLLVDSFRSASGRRAPPTHT
jgi:inosine-uridine nucleoside N-ribohydrolase